ncbi:MAG: Nicotinate-nucleotide adenylyltransferase [Verrucomicrobia bacterium ADurb.Bin474]|nr:MAG: Nicotinate-nucleotide adenylyltransferase [Verrucomicrobia bacterium ADurb.Bin474]
MSEPRRRVGLFGGSFDPPHIGHAVMALDACESMALDELWFVPAYQAPLKGHSPVASARHRLEMIRILANADSRFRVWQGELLSERPCFTVETVDQFHRARPDVELFLFIGADQANQLDKWYQVDRIKQMARLVVFARPGYILDEGRGLTGIRTHQIELSSSEIRERLTRGLPVSIFLPTGIDHYIQNHQLYLDPKVTIPESSMRNQKTDQKEIPSALKDCCEALLDKKAVDLRIIDVKGVSSITDYYVLATGESGPQLRAMANSAYSSLKSADGAKGVVDGDPLSGWVVMDAYEFVVHLFRPEVRENYALESLWKDRPQFMYVAEEAPAAAEKKAVKTPVARKTASKKTAAAKSPDDKQPAEKKAATRKPSAKKVVSKKSDAKTPSVVETVEDLPAVKKPRAKRSSPK